MVHNNKKFVPFKSKNDDPFNNKKFCVTGGALGE
jgi:hypothetical protein